MWGWKIKLNSSETQLSPKPSRTLQCLCQWSVSLAWQPPQQGPWWPSACSTLIIGPQIQPTCLRTGRDSVPFSPHCHVLRPSPFRDLSWVLCATPVLGACLTLTRCSDIFQSQVSLQEPRNYSLPTSLLSPVLQRELRSFLQQQQNPNLLQRLKICSSCFSVTFRQFTVYALPP